jgi:hypothetical protein
MIDRSRRRHDRARPGPPPATAHFHFGRPRVTGTPLPTALADARDLPDDPEKVAALARLARRAETTGAFRLAIEIRLDLLATLHRTHRWRMLPEVRRCWSRYDRRPALFTDRQLRLLRRHQAWAVATVPTTWRIALTRGRAALAESIARGLAPRVVERMRCQLAAHVGDRDEVREGLLRWHRAAQPADDDCVDCDRCERAELLAEHGAWAAAVATLRPLWRVGERCGGLTARVRAAAILPLLQLGRYAEAARAHAYAYHRHRLTRSGSRFLPIHLRYCALTGDHDRGLRILAAGLPWLDRPVDELSALELATAGALVCRAAVAAGHGGSSLRLDHATPTGAAPEPVTADIATVGAVLSTRARELATRFDARNGTTHQSTRMASWLATVPVTTPVPCPGDDGSDSWPGDDGSDPWPGAPAAVTDPDQETPTVRLRRRHSPHQETATNVRTVAWATGRYRSG